MKARKPFQFLCILALTFSLLPFPPLQAAPRVPEESRTNTRLFSTLDKDKTVHTPTEVVSLHVVQSSTQDGDAPSGAVRFEEEGVVVAGTNQTLVVKLTASEPTKWNAPAFTSTCGMTGLPSGFATDPHETQTITTTAYIPPSAVGQNCTITGSITTYGTQYPTTSFTLTYDFSVQGTQQSPISCAPVATNLSVYLPYIVQLAAANPSPDARVVAQDSPARVRVAVSHSTLPIADSARHHLQFAINASTSLTQAVEARAFILRELESSLNGTFASDNALLENSVDTFNHWLNAAACLENIVQRGDSSEGEKATAQQALDHVIRTAHLVNAKPLEAVEIFGPDIPEPLASHIVQAREELGLAEQYVSQKSYSEAMLKYASTWQKISDLLVALWGYFDIDGDYLLPGVEEAAGSDPAKLDTDGDQISDSNEVTLTGTNPTDADTDDTGAQDGDKDPDQDGLTHLIELSIGTHPLRADTDGDGLSDQFEVLIFKTNPSAADTDEDGLSDGSEYQLGTNPNVIDSDGDGIIDSEEVYTTAASGPSSGVSVELTGVGDVAGTVTFQTLISDTLYQQLPGQLSNAIDIETDAAFSSARVKIPFDINAVPAGDVANLRIFYYDEAQQTFIALDTHGVDVANGYAWADTTHFTTFVLFYIPTWNTVWTYQMEPGRDITDPAQKNIDVVQIIDSSGSMQQNDPQNYRLTAGKEFIDALLPGDRVGVVRFDYGAWLLQALTTDFAAAKQAIDSIPSNGIDTYIGAGVSTANGELINNGDPDHYKVAILLTDGIGYYDPALTAQAQAAQIVIYTIGLGSNVDAALLSSIASETGGQYFAIADAEDLPTVFSRIAQGPGPTTDTDEDGLFDWLETQGIRKGNGTIITTNAQAYDTDGDGLSDGEEVGTLRAGPQGDYYTIITDPSKADTDGDGLLDPEELDSGTTPSLADTDGDGLSDLIELGEGFDPFHRNIDGDSIHDAEEYEKGSDPYAYNRTGLEQFQTVAVGALLGDSGENLANLGVIPHDLVHNLEYVAGWLLSGFVVYGDIRDTIAAALRGDKWDTFLNFVGIVPLLGDGSKVSRVVKKFTSWSPQHIAPLTRWLANQLSEKPDVLKSIAKNGLGWDDRINLPDSELVQLMKGGNKVDDVAAVLLRNPNKFILGGKSLSGSQWSNVDNRVNTLWNITTKAQRSEALGVEAAVEFLTSSGYKLKYVGRRQPIELLGDAKPKTLVQGPDIIAVNPATGKTVIVEVKGSQNSLQFSEQLLRKNIGGGNAIQPSRAWLVTQSKRYLRILNNAKDAEVREAGQLVERLTELSSATYEALVIGVGKQSNAYGPGMDKVLEGLEAGTSTVRIHKIDLP